MYTMYSLLILFCSINSKLMKTIIICDIIIQYKYELNYNIIQLIVVFFIEIRSKIWCEWALLFKCTNV